MTDESIILWDPVPDSPISTYSCSLYSFDQQTEFLDSSCYALKSDIDRSLPHGTGFDTSCLDELETELLDAPLESFAAMCYQTAVDRKSGNDPTWGMFIKTPDPVNWQDEEDSIENESLRFATSFDERREQIPETKPASPFIYDNLLFTKRSMPELSLNISSPYQLKIHAASMMHPKPSESVDYYPTTAPKKSSKKKSLSRVIRRIASLPRSLWSS